MIAPTLPASPNVCDLLIVVGRPRNGNRLKGSQDHPQTSWARLLSNFGQWNVFGRGVCRPGESKKKPVTGEFFDPQNLPMFGIFVGDFENKISQKKKRIETPFPPCCAAPEEMGSPNVNCSRDVFACSVYIQSITKSQTFQRKWSKPEPEICTFSAYHQAAMELREHQTRFKKVFRTSFMSAKNSLWFRFIFKIFRKKIWF